MARRGNRPSETVSLTPHSGIAELATVALSSTTQARQPDARNDSCWGFFESLGEVHYPLTLGANLISKIDVVVEERKSNGTWERSNNTEARRALEVIEQAGERFLRSLYINYSVVGEGRMLFDSDSDGVMTAEFLSTDEIRQQTDGTWIRRTYNGAAEEPVGRARVVMAWRPSPRWSGKADSALASVLTECKELEVLKLSLLAKITSRLASQGILFLPSGLSIPANATGERPGSNSVLSYLKTLFEATKVTDGTAAAAMPVLLQGPGELGDQIRHIVLDTALSEADERHRQELRVAIAQGLELPRQTQTNETSGVNHWGMWNVAESALGDHVMPIARAGTNALTEHFLRPWLRSKDVSPNKVRSLRFNIDPTRAALSIVRTDGARQLYDRNLLSDAAMMMAHGFSDADAPSVDEVIRGIGIKLNNPMLATWGLDAIIPPELLQSGGQPGVGGYAAPDPMANPENPATPQSGLNRS